jgi:RHS repeat-associated protein
VNGGPTTTYSYDNADQLTSDGTSTYSYDGNGNLTGRGTDTFAWDYDNRLASSTVSGGTTTSYAYDTAGIRVGKTTGGVTTNYLWDRGAGTVGATCGSCTSGGCTSAGQWRLPHVVDDGTRSYLDADGLLEEVDAAGQPTYDLGDGLRSVRGLSDLAGTLTGTADYDVFGAVRTSSGASSTFGFTGEQLDPETGYTFLRARYLDHIIGRFISADTVRPNAPGTQGYNPYAYVANNPTTWADPSGHAFVPPPPALPMPSPFPRGTGVILVTAIVVARAAPALNDLGQQIRRVLEYLALVLNQATRAIIDTIAENDGSHSEYCFAWYRDMVANCRAKALDYKDAQARRRFLGKYLKAARVTLQSCLAG